MRRSEKNPLLFKNGNPVAPGLMEQLSFVYSCVKPFIWRAIAVIAVVLLIWAASCISPMLQQNLVDSFNNFDKRGVLIYGILTAVTLLIWRGGDTLWGLLASLLNVQMGAHLKKIFFRHLLKLPLGVIESGGAGYLGQDVITEPKTKQSVRLIEIPEFLKQEIKDFIDGHYGMPENERLFPIVQEAVQHKMKHQMEKAGVKKIRVHDLRHSHVAYLINKGIEPILIKERVGHKDIRITLNTYGHLYPNQQRKVADMLDFEKEKSPNSGNC